MKDLKGFLQKAIIMNDMQAVREFYTTIFGEIAPVVVTQPVDSDSLQKIEAIKKIILGELVEEEYNETDYSDDKEEEVEYEEEDKQSVGVKFISSSEFELPEDSDPKYAAAVKKMSSRKKQYRDEYKPNFKNCEVCSTRFDFNKEYPVGLLQSDNTIKIKCNKCRIK
jgi:hypothetical protein